MFAHKTRSDLPLVNIQADGATAKGYQVRQVLRLIEEHKLEVR